MAWIGPEQHEAENQREFIRDWTKRNIPLFEEILNRTAKKFVAHPPPIIDIGDDELEFILHPDPFSRPLCHAVVNDFPDDMLEQGIIKKNDFSIKPSGKQFRQHSNFRFNDYQVEPTIGQFFIDFNHVIAMHRKLFVGRVLVATKAEIKEAFHLTYSI